MTPRPTGFDLQQSVGYLVNRVAKEMKESLEAQMARHGTTAHQWAVLIRLYQGEAQTGNQLAALLGIDGAAVTRLLDRLEAKDLVVRRSHPLDRRAWLVELTAKGRALTPKLVPIALGVLEEFLTGFSRSEVDQLVQLLRKMLGNIEHGREEEP